MIYTNSYFKLLAVISARRGISSPVTCKRLSSAGLDRPPPLLPPPSPPLRPTFGSFLLQARSSFHSVGLETAYSIPLNPSRSRLCALVSAWSARARAGIYYRFVHESRSEMEQRRRKRERERERERTEPGPGWLSLAHLLDAIQSMRGLDLVPPPQTARVYTPREISAAAPFIEETKTRIEPRRVYEFVTPSRLRFQL